MSTPASRAIRSASPAFRFLLPCTGTEMTFRSPGRTEPWSRELTRGPQRSANNVGCGGSTDGVGALLRRPPPQHRPYLAAHFHHGQRRCALEYT